MKSGCCFVLSLFYSVVWYKNVHTYISMYSFYAFFFIILFLHNIGIFFSEMIDLSKISGTLLVGFFQTHFDENMLGIRGTSVVRSIHPYRLHSHQYRIRRILNNYYFYFRPRINLNFHRRRSRCYRNQFGFLPIWI